MHKFTPILCFLHFRSSGYYIEMFIMAIIHLKFL